MTENYTVCNCMQVSFSDICDVIEGSEKFDDVLSAFDKVQAITSCSTGCGGCHQKIMDIISDLINN